jgi:isoleucyl-tRNA synthetase
LRFFPERWAKVYDHWMANIQDWCISRQLWWGHQIPVWYRGEEVKCQVDSPGPDWQQDPDVLDTWCSSWLWPFATMDEATKKKFYPTTVLVTRARNSLLLGGAHDHGWFRIHQPEALSRCLFHGDRAGQNWTEDVQNARQLTRSARPHRQIRG